MKYYLAKTDPETYSIDDLEKEGIATWDGVRNPTAVKTLKAMEPGDKVLIYHSQGQTTIVGLAQVVGNSRPDPQDAKSWLVDLKLIRRFKEPFITLRQIKETGLFDDFILVRRARLSTMAVPEIFITWLKQQGLVLD